MASLVLLVLRLALAAVFAAAALAKLRDRVGARRAAMELGVPPGAAAGVAVALAVVELAVATALVPRATAVGAAVAAGGLLVAFSVAIAAALLRGSAPACHCFGELSAAPVGPMTLARNSVLLALAGVVAVAGPGGTAARPVVGLAVGALAVVVGAVVFALRVLAVHGRVLVRLDAVEAALRAAGLEVEAPAAGVGDAGGGADGGAERGLSLGERAPEAGRLALDPERPTLLLFTDPTCGPCRALDGDVAAWRERSDLAVRTVSARPGGDGHVPDVLDPGGRITAAFGAGGTPAAVVVGADGRVASALSAGAEGVRALVRALPVERVVPAGAFATLGGGELDVAALDEEVTLVFWNPSCGYCQAVRERLRDVRGAGRVVLVSSARAEALRDEGLPFATVLDPEGRIGRALRASGTPMAVRVAGGRAVSAVAVGGPAALALVGDAPPAPPARARVIEVVR